MSNFKSITWASWKMVDSFDPEHFTLFTAFILKPSWEYPVACAALTIRKGTKKILLRMSYDSLCKTIIIPEEYRERLATAHLEALRQAKALRDYQKKIHKMSDLQPGSHVIRTDTGEIIAEAERIIRENDNGEKGTEKQ